METEMFGWREGILLLVGLAVLYLVVTVIRLLRVGKRSAESGKLPLTEPQVTENLPVPELTETIQTLPITHSNEWNDVVDLDLLGDQGVENALSKAAPPVGGFGEQLAEHLARSDLEREVRQLRKEVDAMRAELDELRTLRNISPHYAEALSLAQRGLTARDVADRMGISLAEAELVQALSRGDSLFDEGQPDGADRDDGEPRDAREDRYEPGFGYEPRRNG